MLVPVLRGLASRARWILKRRRRADWTFSAEGAQNVLSCQGEEMLAPALRGPSPHGWMPMSSKGMGWKPGMDQAGESGPSRRSRLASSTKRGSWSGMLSAISA
jgi:hypothetical protein